MTFEQTFDVIIFGLIGICILLLVYCVAGLFMATYEIDIGPEHIESFIKELYYICFPNKLSQKKIREIANPHVARRLFERYGFDRYINNSKDYICSEVDEIGTLYYFTYHNQQETVFVAQVKNSTPEPDGTYKDYYIRVPPNFNRSQITIRNGKGYQSRYPITAKTAIAWSFGLTPDQYNPKIES